MFLLFACPNYYPNGGLNDCKGVFNTLAETEAAIAKLDETYMDDCHVLQIPEMIVRDYCTDGSLWRERTLAEFMA